MRARTRGTRGGESTARLAPSRQLEHSRPLRVLRVRPSVRSLPPRYHLLFFSSSPRALLATACLRPFFHLALLLLETLASRARERKREVRFLPAVFLLFSASSFDAQRDRDILIVGKYYENRIKIEFEKEDGAREAKFYTYERLSNYLDNRFHGIKCREARIKEATSLSVPAIPVAAFR